MMNRRVFLKNGSLALVSLGFAPAFIAVLWSIIRQEKE